MPVRLRGKNGSIRDEQANTAETNEESTEGHTVTAGLSILAGAFERADENILPAVFKGLERDLKWRPSQLGQLVMARTLVMAMASPIFGTLADAFIGRRERLIGWGCFGWAVLTALVAFLNSFWYTLLAFAMMGVALASVVPAVMSIVADAYPSHQRTRAFSALWSASNLIATVAALVATNVSGQAENVDPASSSLRRFMLSWRGVFFGMGGLSAVVGGLVLALARDPLWLRADFKKEWNLMSMLATMWRDVKYVLPMPTFVCIIVQGVFGTMPWQVLPFLTLWYQNMGFSSATAANLYMTFSVGGVFGTLLGGYVADKWNEADRDGGLLKAAIVSCSAGIPFTVIVLHVLPHHPSATTAALHAAFLFSWTLVCSWCGAINATIFSNIVPQELRSSIFAFDRALEIGLSAFTPLVVGVLTESFGYDMNAAGGEEGGSAETEESTALNNTASLANAMLLVIVPTWSITALTFVFLLRKGYYPQDRDRIFVPASAHGERMAEEERPLVVPTNKVTLADAQQ